MAKGHEKVKPKSVKSDDIVIALVGVPGSGKSTFVRRALQQHTGTAKDQSLAPKTMEIRGDRITHGEKRCVLLDTPGIDYTGNGENAMRNLLLDIEGWLPKRKKLAGFLYFHRISDNRITGTPVEANIAFIAQLCGVTSAERIALVTTMWNSELPPMKSKKIEREKELTEKHWKGLVDGGAAVERFDDSTASAWSIINKIIDTSRPLFKEKRSGFGFPRLLIFGSSHIPAPPSGDELIIALVGPTGSGKTAFISTATNDPRGVGHSLEPCTGEITVKKFHGMARSFLDIAFVDTPGFDDRFSPTNTLAMTWQWLKNGHGPKAKLAGLLYFHRISDNRVTSSPHQNIKAIADLCGKSPLSNVILTTTMWDEVDVETGEAREKELVAHCWRPMLSQGGRYMRHQYTEESAWAILDTIVQDHDKKFMAAVQAEIDGMKPRTRAAQDSYGRMCDIVKSMCRTLQRVRTCTRQNAVDETMQILREEYESTRERLKVAVRDLEQGISNGGCISRLITSRLE